MKPRLPSPAKCLEIELEIQNLLSISTKTNNKMFRIISARPTPLSGSATKDPSSSLPQEALEDILMAEEFQGDGAGPSRAQAVGLGRITGPGESIADSSKWMR